MSTLKDRKLLKLTESGKLFHTLITLHEKNYTLTLLLLIGYYARVVSQSSKLTDYQTGSDALILLQRTPQMEFSPNYRTLIKRCKLNSG